MHKSVRIAQDGNGGHRELQKVIFEAVFLQHIDITVFRGGAARLPGVVVVGHDGEQRPHHAVLLQTPPFSLPLHGNGQPQRGAVGKVV